MSKVHVLLADDHPTFRAGLVALLQTDSAITVVGEAGSGDEVIALAEEIKPDVIIMDIQMPNCNGVEAIRYILQKDQQVRILVMTMFEDDHTVAAAMRAGARGYILKGALPDEIIRAIRAVAAGEAIFSQTIAIRFMEYFDQIRPGIHDGNLSMLTYREREVLDLIARGYRNAEIAEMLVLSPSTVRNHITNILSKLQVADRAEAILKAKDAGLGK
ncbi:LuxR family two component transcriptional regulator [Bacillus oleivorans]|uniref:LuxR family two component transcriptional regulator n=1 Tax=Bacillus oleivorans TaxID=1448271 RepID=A0A285CUL8_9BACI|nr:response regulator transcription factor [Bacillus oleivorans]SNX70736.1 LuxR family two component transcriptional regulator [Bacillus oleivorans]